MLRCKVWFHGDYETEPAKYSPLSGIALFSRARHLLRRSDVRGLVRSALQRGPQRAIHRSLYYLFELRNDGSCSGSSGRTTLPEGYDFRRAMPDEVMHDCELGDSERKEFARRFAEGDLCYAVFHGVYWVNLSWLHFGACYVRGPGLLLELAHGDGYVYNVSTRVSYRGRGLYGAAQARLGELLIQNRVPRTLQLVEAGNAAPLRVLPRLGYVRTQTVRALTAFGLKRTAIQLDATMATVRQTHWRVPAKMFRI